MSDGKTGDAASFGDVLRSLREIRRAAMSSADGEELAGLNKSLQGIIDRRRRAEEKRLAKQEAVRNAARRKRPSAFAAETGPTGKETAKFWEDEYERAEEMRQDVIKEQRELEDDLDQLTGRLQALAQIDRMLR